MGRCQPSLTECHTIQRTDASHKDNKQLNTLVCVCVCEGACVCLVVCSVNFNEKRRERHWETKTQEIELWDCLPLCLDWRLLLFVTPMLRATDQIRDAMRQMSALALCSRHECCWHTNRRGMAARGKKGREQSEHRGRAGWHEKGEEGKENRRRRKGWGNSHVTSCRLHQQDEIYSVTSLSETSLGRKRCYKFRHTSSWPRLTWGTNRRSSRSFWEINASVRQHTSLVSVQQKKPDKTTSFQSGTATQKSTHDLHTTTRFHSEEQHTIKMMRREKKGANYSRAAGWPETNLIIIIVKKAQRKPAASPLPPQSNREAFSLRNDLESDKSNRFTVTAWKGPARTL